MEKLYKIDDLIELQDHLKNIKDQEINKPTIIISAGTCGQASGANDVIRLTKREILTRGLTEKLNIRITGCHGFCQMEPSILVEPKRTLYPKIKLESVPKIIESVSKDHVINELLYLDPESGLRIEKQDDIPFFKKQNRQVLSSNEKLDPIRIYNYIENEGYKALSSVLLKNEPRWVIEEVKLSKLRGRGGAGFPTGLKWELLEKQRNGTGKFLICNADEGDPGAYMDRSVLEGNPHSVIEGMIIGAFATGASEGIIYVRNEYPLAIKHLIIALRQARDIGLLGNNILGTNFSFNISIVKGAGAFVCGEETALIKSIEGKIGEPRQRPPFPVEKGIDGKPTLINNVETWANIPIIINKGAINYVKIGTQNNSGTKIFSLVGKVKNTGLVEVPMGITIKEIVNDIGGGSVSSTPLRAVQTGGPSGGCIPTKLFDLPIDYESLSKAGSIMGSGGMIVMDNNTCMVDLAKYFMNFLKDESCGKCFTCRKGTQRMYEILDDITKGKAELSHIDLLEELAQVVKDTSMCALGQSAPNPVLSTLRYFKDEYTKHIWQKKCDAFICKELVGAPCQTACPIGTEAWRYIAHIANGEYENAYIAIREANPFPSVCARVCNHPCEDRCKSGTTGNQAIAIRALKRFITDRIDPKLYIPVKKSSPKDKSNQIAIIGSGPAGLTAAHYLSINGYNCTVFESDDRPGGMLISGIPAYRLSREVLQKEIDSLIDENITVKCNTVFGKEFSINDLTQNGFRAIFIAMGAHKSRQLNIEGENLKGIYPAIKFLKEFNLRGINLASGRVGIIGGGDSAVDAARVALRNKNVTNVTIFYRRTREEMPALDEEIDAALFEGIKLETLVSPVKIISENEILTGLKCIRNILGEIDASGRRKPIPIENSEFTLPLDTLIITIGDVPEIDYVTSLGLSITEHGTLKIDEETLETNLPGVFAGGDVVTGPNTVVEAIAAGKKAAVMIDRFIRGEKLKQAYKITSPSEYVRPTKITVDDANKNKRTEPKVLEIESRKFNFNEVEISLNVDQARREASRCLRCDLDFTKKIEND